MKTLAVVVTTPPYSPLTVTALTMHANENISIASDEYQAIVQWQRLQQQYQLPLHICITAAEKRGIACDSVDNEQINEAFTVSGLGELVELTTKATRLVQF